MNIFRPLPDWETTGKGNTVLGPTVLKSSDIKEHFTGDSIPTIAGKICCRAFYLQFTLVRVMFSSRRVNGCPPT